MESDFLANAVVKFDLAGRNTLNSFYERESEKHPCDLQNKIAGRGLALTLL